MRLDLTDLNVLVTGGSRGLGAAIAQNLAGRGARVAVTSRFPAEAPPAPGVVCLTGDVADPRDNAEVFAQLATAWGRVDAVVHNVALSAPVASLGAWREASAEITLRNGVWPLVDLLRAAEAHTGRLPARVVVISSLGAAQCPPQYAHVGVSKAALEALTRYLAVDLAPAVRFHTVRFGFLDTEGLRAMFAAEVLAKIQARGGFLALDQAADLVAALCAGLFDAATGHVITADGGLSLLSPLQLLEDR